MNLFSNTYRLFFGILLGLLFLGTTKTSAQQTGCFDLPYLQFLSPTLVSGSAGQLNAQYRFSNVTPGIDALVTIIGRQNANLTTIDQNDQGGTNEAFQPQIGVANVSSGEGFYDFRIEFVEAGTSTPTSLDEFAVSALDVDGNNNTTREFVGFKAGESYTIEGATNLNASYVSPYNLFEAATSNQINGIDPDDTNNLVYLRYGQNTSFQIRAGVKNPNNTGGRLFSFDFNSCIRNNFQNAQTTTIDADISVNKTVNNTTPEIAETIEYTIAAQNNGPRTGTGIQITDQLPAGLSFVNSTVTQGSYDSGTGIWTVGDLNSGSTSTLTIEATVNTGTGGTSITNTATVSRLNQNDPNTANNSNSAVINVEDSTPAPTGVQACTELTGSWNGSGGTWTSTTSSGIGVTVTLQAGTGGAWNNTTNGTMNTIDAWSEPDVQGATSLQSVFFWDTSPESGTPASDDGVTGTFTVSFDRPVFNPVLHIDRLGGTSGGEPNTAEWRPITPGASITRLAGPDHFVTRAPRFFRSLTGNTTGSESSLNTANGTAAGSVLFEGEFSEVQFRLAGLGREGVGGDGMEFVMCGHSRDFGDLPDPYQSTLSDGGPSHQITGGSATHFLGTEIDAEADGQPTADADGDNANGTNDEDGITLPALVRNGDYTIAADVTGSNGYLQAWIDWNGDGDFDDTVDGVSERIATDLQDGDSDGTINVPVSVPASATTDQTYARFRWSTIQGLNETDHARDGEVEDYSLTISNAEITGIVFEDITGDALDDGDNTLNDAAGDQQGRANVRVLLFSDGGDGLPDGNDDTFVESTTTDANGEYTFSAAPDNYWVAVDSRSGSLTNGTTWAEQTYAATGAFCSDGAGGTTSKTNAGPCFGGRRGNQSDNLPASPNGASLANAEHLIEVDLSGAESTENDFGFSYNVVTDVRDGDDDGAAARTIQGSLRQFIQNANSIGGANAMRFVPSVPLNQGSWWQVAINSALPDITGAETTIDGTAYDLSDGVTVRNTNTGSVGSGGTVGVDGLPLNTFARKELEINLTDKGGNAFRLNTTGSATVREVAVYNNSNLLRVSNVSGGMIENNFWGARADGTDPGGSLRGGTAINFNGTASVSATISNSYIAYTTSTGVGSGNTNANGVINTSEFFQTALTSNAADGIDVTGTWTIEQSLFHENGNAASQPERGGAGIEIGRPSGTAPNSVMRNNTIHTNAVSGINLLNQVNDNLIEKNVIFSNGTNYQGAGTLLGAGIKVTSPDGQNDVQGNRITQNSIYQNFGLGIDLVGTYDGGADSGQADGVTRNDPNDSDTGPNTLFNFPIIEEADLGSGGDLILRGFARPGTIIEVFIADEDPSGFGEGKTYLFTVQEGSADDRDVGTGAYSGLINGENQGNDVTQRFDFSVNIGNSISIGDVITATGTDANGNTSEFNGAVEVTGIGNEVTGTVFNDANHNSIFDEGENGISGVAVVLHDPSANSCRSVQTNTDGVYIFEDVSPGDYQVIESASETTPDPGNCPPVEEDPAGFVSTTSNTIDIMVQRTQETNINFGDFNGSRLTGTVFNDNGSDGGTANDGIQNGAEGGIPGSTVRLTDASGNNVHAEIKTGGEGSYTFFIPDALSGSPLRVAEMNFDNYISTGGDAGNTGGSYDRVADATTFTPTSGTEYIGVNFGDVPDNSFSTDGEQNTTAGSTVFFPHTFVARTTGEVSFSTTNTANPANTGWKQTIFRDNNCNGEIDGSDQIISNPVSVTLGQKMCIIVRAATPSGVPQGSSNTITVTADFNYTNASPSLSRSYTRTDLVNITDASGSGLKITKQVDQAQALPGATLTYTISYTNNGSAPLNNLKIEDSTPAFTTFTSASCQEPLPDNLTSCTINDPAAGESGSISWIFEGSLLPGSSSTVTYQVTIKN